MTKSPYAAYRIEERESLRSASVGFDSATGIVARFFFALGRVPRESLIVVWHFQGATELERAQALQSAEHYRDHGPACQGVALPSWRRRKRKTKPGYFFHSPRLGVHLDEDGIARAALASIDSASQHELTSTGGVL